MTRISRIPQTIGVTNEKQYSICRWCFFHMLRKGKLSLSSLKIKRPCIYLMFSKAKSPIKLLNLSKRIILWLYTSLIIRLINFNHWTKRKRPRERVFKGKVWILVCSVDYNQFEGGSSAYDAQVPLKLSVIKLIYTKWLLGLYDHLRNSSDTIIKWFAMDGIKDKLMMELLLEDPFGELDTGMLLINKC